jgi:tape measure domain-containing protein
LPELKKLGDIAAGVGLDKFPQLTLAYGQVRAATKLTGAELRQFTEAGVPLLDELAKHFGTTAGAVQEMISDGGVKFKDVSKALQNLTSDGGRFNDLMAKQALTLGGVLSSVEDGFIKIQRELGQPLLEPMKAVANTLLKIVNAVSLFAKNNPKLVEFAIYAAAIAAALALIVGPILMLVGFLPAIVAGFAAIPVVLGAIGTFAIPILLVVAAIAAIITVVVLLVKHWDTIKAKTIEVWSAITTAVGNGVNAVGTFITTKMTEITNWMISTWNGIKDFFQTLWNGIVEVVKFSLALMAGSIIAYFDLMGIDIVAVLTQWTQWFIETWEKLKLFTDEGLKAIGEFINVGLNVAKTIWTTVWGAISSTTSSVWARIKSLVGEGLEFMKGLFTSYVKPLTDAMGGLWDSIGNAVGAGVSRVKDFVKGMLNDIIEMVNAVIRKINSVAQKGAGGLGMDIASIPEIPKLAKGGIVTEPTIAMIGEAGPEAVVPLSRGGGMGGTINITINGDVSGEELVRKVGDELTRMLQLSTATV